MRLGITLPLWGNDGKRLGPEAIGERARMVEAAGFDGLWRGDSPSDNSPDTLAYLLLAGQATEQIEIGTCIYCIPQRNPIDVAERLATLEMVAPGRITLGVGTGSSSRSYEMIGLPWEDRFRLLREKMDTILGAVFDGRPLTPTEGPRTGTWAQEYGAPRFVLGAWHSDAELKRAAEEYDGWMGSGWGSTSYTAGGVAKGNNGLTNWASMGDTIKRYRDRGGNRAMLCSINIDLRAPTTDIPDDSPFFLQCQPDAARERLNFLEEIGFDDVIVVPRPPGPAGQLVPNGGGERYGPGFHDYTIDELEEIRALVPPDPRRYTDTSLILDRSD